MESYSCRKLHKPWNGTLRSRRSHPAVHLSPPSQPTPCPPPFSMAPLSLKPTARGTPNVARQSAIHSDDPSALAVADASGGPAHSLYAEMAERRRRSNAKAQQRKRDKAKLKLMQQSNSESDRSAPAPSSVLSDIGVSAEEVGRTMHPHDSASESDADTLEDEAMLLYHFISVVEPLVNESEHLSLTSMTFVAVYKAIYTRLGLPVHVMEQYDSINPIPASWRLHQQSCTRRSVASARNAMSCNSRDDTGSQTPEQNLAWDALPPNMHPTALQLSDDHHAFFDIFCPWPKVRDRVLRSLRDGSIDQREFCKDLLQHPLTTGASQPLIVWQGGDPADADNWELQEAFAKRYADIFDQDVVHRTNWWRAKRGLEPILLWKD